MKDDTTWRHVRENDGGPVINFLADVAQGIAGWLLKKSMPYAKMYTFELQDWQKLNDGWAFDEDEDEDYLDAWLHLERNQLENSNKFMYTHKKEDCKGEWCTIHNRSDHIMRAFPQHFRYDRMLMERICPHEIGHPDPDDIKLTGPYAESEAVHGCDGCCGMDIKKKGR